MDVSATSTSTKNARSKGTQGAASAAKPKRLTTARKKAGDAASPTSIAELQPGAMDLHGMIERAAYELAAQQGFAPGHEMDDWLEAERRVNATLA